MRRPATYGFLLFSQAHDTRLTPDEVAAVLATCIEQGINMDASKPAQPIHWERAELEN